MVTGNFFQCIGKVRVSIFLSLSRQLLILVPLLAVLPQLFELKGVWCALPASDTIASLIALAILVTYMRKFKKQTRASRETLPN